MNKDILYYIWLAESFSYGSMKPMQIARNIDDLHRFYENLDEEAKLLGLNEKCLLNLKKRKLAACCGILKKCQKLGVSVVCFDDEDYPEKLKNLDSAPLVLYYVGDLSVVNEPSVAIVGTRKADSYGRKASRKIAADLALHGITVVSGCAEGIDMCAHEGAVESGGRTVSVLGTSLEKDYPSGSGALKRKIVDCKGVVISEYAPGTETAPWLFPIRNRLVVGMSDSVVIVQSPEKSGAMITAGIACECGKDVFCVPPADIFDSKNDGIKKCLKDGANLLLDVDDILETYRFSKYVIPKRSLDLNKNKKEHVLEVPDYLQNLFDIVDIDKDLDKMSDELKVSINELLPMLTELEIMGLIEKVGMNYKKC